VLKAGCSFAASNWAPARDPYETAWRELLSNALGEEAVERAIRQVVPWESHFNDPDNLPVAFREAGFTAVRVEGVELHFSYTLEEYLASRELSAGGRFARRALDRTTLEAFRSNAATQFRERFGTQISYTRSVLLAVGVKP